MDTGLFLGLAVGNLPQSAFSANAQQAAAMREWALRGLQNAHIPPEVARLRKAQQYAADVRARRPEMQVRRIA